MKIKSLTLALIAAIISLMALVGCESNAPATGTAQNEMTETEMNQRRLVAADPPPQFKDSQERKNLIRRLNTWNVPNKISYITLMTNAGQVVAYDVVKGKVSDLNSMLTNPEQILDDPHGSYDAGSVTVPSPDFDGSYGSNPNGIFYFTPQGEYKEWNGLYYLSDRPQNITVQPLVTIDSTKDTIKK
jgi:hypothetical protein